MAGGVGGARGGWNFLQDKERSKEHVHYTKPALSLEKSMPAVC